MRFFSKYLLPGLAFFLLARAAQALAPFPDSVVPVWPAAGVGFVSFYLLGAAPAAGILIADALAAMMTGHTPSMAFLLAGGNTLCLGIGGLILRKVTGKNSFLDSLNGMLQFIFAGPVLSAFLAALLGIISLKVGSIHPLEDATLPYWTWYVSDMTGIVIVAPLVTAWTRIPLNLPPTLRSLEGVGMFACAAVLSHFVFSSEGHIIFAQYPLPFVFIPIMAWATFRTGHRIITLLLAMIFVYAVIWTMIGQGHFAKMGYPFSIHILQIFTASAAITSLIIHTMIDSLRSNEMALQRANEELEDRVKRRTRHLNKALSNLRAAEASYRTIFENAMEGIYRTDINHRFRKANQALADILGYTNPRELIEEVHDIRTFVADPADLSRFYELLATKGQVKNFESKARRRDGAEIWLSLSSHPIKDKNGKVAGIEGILQDITDRKCSEQELERRAFSDPLTGAANRHFFDHSFEKMLAQAKRTNSGLALLFLDMDNFKDINDTYGHRGGDDVLIETVTRIQSRLRDADLLARIGGDEFALLIHNTRNHKDAAQIAEDIITALGAEYAISKNPIHIGVSIGGSLYPADGQDMETLLERADEAMYRAKQRGKGQFVLWGARPDQMENIS
ncbi:sensor domain-containing diguanylate cyclase [Desulfovibrio ferrophilus]|uniref:PAS domain S-box/diguanylate cyclase with GGDEF domain n=1 Tax=Desulfovibrio ferrophilus TaxID=241368 RepID=A0A2Z6AU67_9BACT|nr:sensor domain-containing diguanylate cyclase [Desulfovibrio ferrophilus]BBD06771.1 PAS domain S-box/diguanylate cyclase with GGDEF domain [Desulfovibrio ferrophilus]